MAPWWIGRTGWTSFLTQGVPCDGISKGTADDIFKLTDREAQWEGSTCAIDGDSACGEVGGGSCGNDARGRDRAGMINGVAEKAAADDGFDADEGIEIGRAHV